MRTSDKLILQVIHEIKLTVAAREKEVSRAAVSDLYSHGRLQGGLDGLDEALSIIDKVLMGELDPDN
jgi:hypothetical protein